MILYSCKYRKSGSLLWHKIKKIKGDAFIPGTLISQIIQEDETNTEINLMDHEVVWSKERFLSIKEKMSSESGVDMKTR